MFCLLFSLSASAQSMVYLEHSETLAFDEDLAPDAQILRGNVIFRHDSAYMYCDSAYFYERTNSVDAYGHVRFEQGDTLSGSGNRLYYNGNTRLARLRGNVRLVHGVDNPTILTTDSLNYDRLRDVAYYFAGGTIADSLNTLSSVSGNYYPRTKQAVFSREVVLRNPKNTIDSLTPARFVLTSDTLLYNTDTHIADIVSPTTIVYEGETTIRTRLGWYNTQNERSMLLLRSVVEHADGKQMTGDTIFYDKRIGYGRILGNMEMRDTANHATLLGNRGEMFHDGHSGYATDSAQMQDWSDSTMVGYMHADTLFTEEVSYTALRLSGEDTLRIDTTYRRMRAFHNVRLYRPDMQAVCDSADYIGRDSVMTLYTQPVCWSENNQFSADTIRIYMRDGHVDYAVGTGNALTVKQETRDYYDQMAGKEMTAYIRNGELSEVAVNGNAQTVFYPQDDDSTYIGMNTTESSYVTVYLEAQKIHHIRFTTETNGVLYPLDQIPAGLDRLGGFFWEEQERPRRPEDIFLRTERTPRTAPASSTRVETGTTDTPATPQEPPAPQKTGTKQLKKR